jgi:hypothetical protein
MKPVLHFLFSLFMVGCASNYEPEKTLSNEQIENYLLQLAIHVDTRPEEIKATARFDTSHLGYYRQLIDFHDSQLSAWHIKEDTVYFLYKKRDPKSLYEHYRFVGGKLLTNEQEKIVWLDQLFVTPRLAPDQLIRGEVLYEEMIKTGGVSSFWANADYLEWPDADYVYSPEQTMWVLQDTSRLKGILPYIQE